MDIGTITRLLQNAGLKVIGTDRTMTHIIIEEPGCIYRSFETFLGYAWTIIVFITGILIFGWAISKIIGGKTDIKSNMITLIIIFGTLSATKPIINTIYGDDIVAKTCKNIQVPVAELQQLLDMRNKKMSKSDDFYEQLNIAITDESDTESVDINSLQPIKIPDFVLEQ